MLREKLGLSNDFKVGLNSLGSISYFNSRFYNKLLLEIN